jgi:hypothetical protein
MAVGSKVCYCCSLPTGLYISNLLILLILTGDVVFTRSYLSAMTQMSGILAPPTADNSIILWSYGVGTASVGVAGLALKPSRVRGLLLTTWRSLVYGFIAIWVVYSFQTIGAYGVFEIEKFANLVFSKTNLSNLPIFRWISTALEWWIITNLSADSAWAVFAGRNWSILLYFYLIIPLCVLISTVSHISVYINVTQNGTVSFKDGLMLRREELERRIEERERLIKASDN